MKKIEAHLHTNTNCNLLCLHCYNRSSEGVCYSPPVKEIIDTICFIFNMYDAEMHLEGGEIFLRPDLLREMDSLPDSILHKITVTTNGTIFFNDEKILHMLRRLAALRISIESANPSQHEQIRGFSLEKTLQNAAQYQSCGISVWLRVTLNQMNYKGFLNQHILKLNEYGFRQFQVYEFQNVGRGLDNQDLLSIEHNLNDLIDELCMTSLNGVLLKMMFSQQRKIEILQQKKRLEDNSYRVELIPPEEGISIHANGDVYRCAWTSTEKLCNWYNDENARRILSTSNLIHYCSHCSAIRIVSK